jgi:hypothetical protein
MSTVDLMGTCADCGGLIVNINAATVAKDGWERWECGGCHRHVSIMLESIKPVPAPPIPMVQTPHPVTAIPPPPFPPKVTP